MVHHIAPLVGRGLVMGVRCISGSIQVSFRQHETSELTCSEERLSSLFHTGGDVEGHLGDDDVRDTREIEWESHLHVFEETNGGDRLGLMCSLPARRHPWRELHLGGHTVRREALIKGVDHLRKLLIAAPESLFESLSERDSLGALSIE